MTERKIGWTKQQLRAIAARDSDVLVSASAGTGKTAVLSARCVDIVSDKNACPDVLSILVLTFTEAAAEQMRARIAEQLRRAIRQKPQPHLRHQLLLLQGADISTIHAFCKRIITEHFYELGLDPTFRVIDGDEQRLLKAEVLEKTIDWAWKQSNLTVGLQQLFYRRDLRKSEGFLARIISISDFLDAVVWRKDWCERATKITEAIGPRASGLGEKQKQIVAEKLMQILNQINYAIKLYENECNAGKWAPKWRETFVRPVSGCVELLKAGDWQRCANEILNFDQPTRFEYKPRDLQGPIAEAIRTAAKQAKDEFDKLREFAILNPEYADKVGRAASLQTKVLVELVRKFDELYGQAKRTINCLDFADLEHYALKLLADENSAKGNLLPSQSATLLRSRYKYIFVDEYQDINPVQQAILELLKSGPNFFGVGDVKQSIYAWRGAEPGIFLHLLKQASAGPAGTAAGLRVDLNANFRSAKGILDFVNKVFARIMTATFTKIDYDDSAELRPASTDKPQETVTAESRPAVELHIIDRADTLGKSDGDQRTSIISARQCQAAMIARRIRDMVGAQTGKAQFQIYDKQQDAFRDLEYRDIVILMRSPAKKANDYVEVLRLATVPVSCDTVAGYFEATEISDMLCLLKVLDNPQRDIELAAVMRSPLFNISDTELATVTIHNANGREPNSFYDRIRRYCADAPDAPLAKKLKGVLERIDLWRTLARRGSLADLIWQVYRETRYLSFVCALPNGQTRRANLLKLHDRAIQFEGFASSAGLPSLTRFVQFLEKLQELGQDWTPAAPDSATQNAVRIMSVHKSKGLEFPVVFLAELESPFNKRDVQDQCLTNLDSTLGLQIIDRRSNRKLDSLAHQVIAAEKLAITLAEEMRILYVATTRARERLILTASQKAGSCRDIVCEGFFGDQTISDGQLRRCKSPLDWLLYGLSDQKNLHEALETDLAEKTRDDGLFSMKLYGPAEADRLAEYTVQLKTDKLKETVSAGRKSKAKQTASPMLSQIKASLAWRYRFGDAAALPAKLSVTQLTHRDDEYVKTDYSKALERLPRAICAEQDFIESAEGRVIGTATHLLIAALELTRPISKDAIEQTKKKLITDGAIAKAVAEQIDGGSVMKFFESDLGRTVLDPENSVWREWPFTFGLPAVELAESSHEAPVASDEIIVVQGIIDMLIKTPKGLLVIDFKTDRITPGRVAERADLYRRQLGLYGRAAAAILKTETIAKWLYFLTRATAIEV
jgi:ATP-dependent helicase/nuclease subunit A